MSHIRIVPCADPSFTQVHATFIPTNSTFSRMIHEVGGKFFVGKENKHAWSTSIVPYVHYPTKEEAVFRCVADIRKDVKKAVKALKKFLEGLECNTPSQ